MKIYYIEETNEFTKDEDVYIGATEAGLSTAELDEDNVIRWIQELMKSNDELKRNYVAIARDIQQFCADGVATQPKLYLNLIHNKAQEILNIQ